MRNTCRVSVEERNHDLEQYGAEEANKRTQAELLDRARDLICNGDRLRNLVYDYEADIFPQLARIMRELSQAVEHNPISREAVLNSACHIERILLEKALREVS